MAQRLEFDRSDEGSHTTLYGTRGSLSVHITLRRIPWRQTETRFEQRVTVTAPGPVTRDRLEMAPRERGSKTVVTTSDRSFDREVAIRGAELEASVLLSSSARAAVLGNGGHWTLEGPELKWSAQRAPVFLSATTEQIIELVRAFMAAAEDPVEALSQRVRMDPHPEVRRRAFALLLSHYRSDPRTLSTARVALEDRLARLRVDAALALGEPGKPHLVSVLSARSTPYNLRLAVARHLERGDPEVQAVLEQMLDRSELEERISAVELLGRLGGPTALASLEKLAYSLAVHRQLRRAAKDAQARVLTRYRHLEAGQLAVVPSEPTGAVSLPQRAGSAGRTSPASADPDEST